MSVICIPNKFELLPRLLEVDRWLPLQQSFYPALMRYAEVQVSPHEVIELLRRTIDSYDRHRPSKTWLRIQIPAYIKALVPEPAALRAALDAYYEERRRILSGT